MGTGVGAAVLSVTTRGVLVVELGSSFAISAASLTRTLESFDRAAELPAPEAPKSSNRLFRYQKKKSIRPHNGGICSVYQTFFPSKLDAS